MIKYRNLKDWKGSPNGVRVVTYPKGEEQELPPELAEAALVEGWVEEVKAKKSEPENEDKKTGKGK